jgi:hypothetical protein
MAGNIDQLIVNAPYDEPTSHWRYDRESRTFSLAPGRRPAGYVVATPGSKAFDDPGIFVPLPLVNRIRPRVKAWREAGYPGATGTTLRLLQHWRDPETFEERRFFFYQLEAIETLIWLTEAPPGERQGIEVDSDERGAGDITHAGLADRVRDTEKIAERRAERQVGRANHGLPPSGWSSLSPPRGD